MIKSIKNKAVDQSVLIAAAELMRKAKSKKDDFSGALADYDKAIEIDPNEDVYFFNRALIKEEFEDYLGAISDYSKAIELNNGVRRIPVILFDDKSILVEPTAEELKAKMALQ